VALPNGSPTEVRGKRESRQLGSAPHPVDRTWKAMVWRGINGGLELKSGDGEKLDRRRLEGSFIGIEVSISRGVGLYPIARLS
jgi:hypothetical protein